MAEKPPRLTAVLDERIKAKGSEGLAAMKDIRALAAFDADVLAAIATDSSKRGLSLERGLEMARRYVETGDPEETPEPPAPDKQPDDHQDGDHHQEGEGQGEK